MDNFEGDPLMILNQDGVTLNFKDGQPTMDQGFENMAQISLLSAKGFWGNDLVNNPDQKIGSDYVEAVKLPITVTQLKNISSAAKNDLKNPAFGNVESVTKNLNGNSIRTENTIRPPGRDEETLITQRSGSNWFSQRDNPAHLKD